jgi:GT2 family glycosyltransferase
MNLLSSIVKWTYRGLPRPARLHVRWLYFAAKSLLHLLLNASSLRALAALQRQRYAVRNTSRIETSISIDLCLVTYNSQHWLQGFFSTLLRLDYDLGLMHIRIVDNGSKDDTVATLKNWQSILAPKVASFLLLQQDNCGFGAGHNAAMRTGIAPFILVVNPDVEFQPDSLGRCVGRASTEPESTASWEFRQKPYEHPKHYDPVSLETNWSSHACVLLRRTAIDRVGGYDPNIFLYGEDVELSYRLRAHGYTLRYCPDAVIWHHAYASAGELKPTQYVGSIAANLYLRWRYGNWSDRAVGLLLFTIVLVRPPAFEGSRTRLLRESRRMFQLALKAPPICGGSPSAHFGFRDFDYELSRQGAFHEATVLPIPTPMVTIITRTEGKRAELLKQAAQSIANQTYQHLEWIVVQDGPEPPTCADLIGQCAAAMHIPVLFHSVAKQGRSNAGNVGLQHARGEFIVFLDDDDLLYADHVETLLGALLKQPSASASYAMSWEVQTEMLNALPFSERFVFNPVYQQEFNLDTLLHHNYIPIQSILFRRTLYETRGGFDTTLDQLEDWNLWLRYAFGNTFIFVDKTTSLFRTPSDRVLSGVRQNHLNQMITKAREQALAQHESLGITSHSD